MRRAPLRAARVTASSQHHDPHPCAARRPQSQAQAPPAADTLSSLSEAVSESPAIEDSRAFTKASDPPMGTRQGQAPPEPRGAGGGGGAARG